MIVASSVSTASRTAITRDTNSYTRKHMVAAAIAETPKHGTLKDFANNIPDKLKISRYSLQN
jgi:hypothetical protein